MSEVPVTACRICERNLHPEWSYCPWCGSVQSRLTGRTTEWRMVKRKDLKGHTLEELAVARASGKTWKDIAQAFGMRPRAGAQDARNVADRWWKAVGYPGQPQKPDRDTGPGYYTSPEWDAWRAQRWEALDLWLKAMAEIFRQGNV